MRKLTTKEFIKKSKKVHGNQYGYSVTRYENARTKIQYICKKHGIIWQLPNSHTEGHGCYKCSQEKNVIKANKNKIVTTKLFIKRAKMIHGNKYNYSKTRYIRSNQKVHIICPKHGEFWQTPNNHIDCRNSCPKCKESRGETAVRTFLESNDIKFKTNYSINGCKRRRKLLFDFYLPEHNIYIEFDGKQHYVPFYLFSKSSFFMTQESDKIKNKFCSENNVELIRIPFWKIKNIPEILGKLT